MEAAALTAETAERAELAVRGEMRLLDALLQLEASAVLAEMVETEVGEGRAATAETAEEAAT